MSEPSGRASAVNAAPARRIFLQATGALAASAAAFVPRPSSSAVMPLIRGRQVGGLRPGMISYMLPHEQFSSPEIVRLGALAGRAGFDMLSNSDHFQPWQANEGHANATWVTMAATGTLAPQAWMGTTVTCPTLRYNPAVVAETFASLSQLYPGRIFLGVGSGEALNEQAATGNWPKWQERWDRLIEAMAIIRALWTGDAVTHAGKYYTVNARLYDPPPMPIPLLSAANGKKSMRLAGQHADGLVTDPLTWKNFKAEWEAGAREAGKDPATMPVLVEQYVVVGGPEEARRAAELWRFGPKAFKSYFNIPDPARIQQTADAQIAIDKVLESWVVGSDPDAHFARIRELQSSGVSIVNIHSGQQDQRRVIEFYGAKILPQLARHA